MDNQNRTYIYAFLSRVFSDSLDVDYITELKSNPELLELIGNDTKKWFEENDIDTLHKETNIDFSTIFLMNAKPIETSIIDAKDEILIGLSNPVMQFYFTHGYELNLGASHLQTPDHISLECAFMQNLVSRNELKAQKEFLQTHLLNWAVPYFIGIKNMASTPLYKDLCEFSVEFLSNDYNEVSQKLAS
ncbi:TorD/DmsD family molecular chaperone [Arcobacter sp. FWKO B]|uniref:TorD/DmsD family molecular chaperone n=1 Tax=Arcobacter sp. FWKO B TaxID=2593672 RepID=UPI0018A41506|nr:molecular chaperone TorD family protein [Arcobacter sp. FWKO B]QOG12409.1 molecular chaperone TorD family protein [Arcobacter sp. FWKO B]